jgi:UDP-3-O-[3-hydroxymyristoyl] N-acetylglucosamine deacetylase/3-hydroxyacyl-[acyl-carrier-protein] dehydratase
LKRQHTITREVEIEGRGLFTGEPVSMKVRPAPPNTGICFVRTDQSPPIRIEALVENVSKRARRTSLRNGTVAIETVEHCLSACSALRLDNLQIELNANELPAMDGSSLAFFEKLQGAGASEQDAYRTAHLISEVARVTEGDSELIALPPLDPDSDTLEITYELDYGPASPIGRQVFRGVMTPENFEQNVASARTFVLEKEAAELRAGGLGSHLNYQDILVFGENGPIDNTLRFPDECVRHKVLDLLGDLSLLGKPLVGRVFARKSGHSLNHALVRVLREQAARRQLASYAEKPSAIDIHRIQRILPHRYPFLMVDRILEIDGTTRAVGLKNVTINEAFFQGHYPGEPIMPGVLIIEALAQLGGVLLSQELQHKGKVAVLLSLDKVKFRRSVRPGDQLVLEVEAIKVRASTGHIRGRARVGGELAAEAEIKFILTDAEQH